MVNFLLSVSKMKTTRQNEEMFNKLNVSQCIKNKHDQTKHLQFSNQMSTPERQRRDDFDRNCCLKMIER